VNIKSNNDIAAKKSTRYFSKTITVAITRVQKPAIQLYVGEEQETVLELRINEKAMMMLKNP
jgi:hypothetical protein